MTEQAVKKEGSALEDLMDSLLSYYGCHTVKNHKFNYLGVMDEFDVDSLHPSLNLRVVVECKQLVSSKFKKDFINTFRDKMSNVEADFGVLCTTSEEDLSRFNNYCSDKKILLWKEDRLKDIIANKEKVNLMTLLMPFSFTSYIDNLPYFWLSKDDKLNEVFRKRVGGENLYLRLREFCNYSLPYCVSGRVKEPNKVYYYVSGSLDWIKDRLDKGLEADNELEELVKFLKSLRKKHF